MRRCSVTGLASSAVATSPLQGAPPLHAAPRVLWRGRREQDRRYLQGLRLGQGEQSVRLRHRSQSGSLRGVSPLRQRRGIQVPEQAGFLTVVI